MTTLLEERISRLERGLIRWRVAGAVALVVAIGSLALLATERRAPAEFRARAFSLIDSSGVELARLADGPGGPFLVVHAKQAGADVMLGSLKGDAGIGIVAHDRTLVSLATGKNGTGLGLMGKGRSRLIAGVVDNNDNAPTLSIWDEGGSPRLMFGLSTIRLRDETGKLLFSVPATKEKPENNK